MDELIKRIEEAVSDLMQYDMEKFTAKAQELAGIMMAVFPVIINSYNDPRMEDVRQDAVYWPGQLEKILKVLEKGDWFEVADTLYNETRPNLIELRDMLTARGIL